MVATPENTSFYQVQQLIKRPAQSLLQNRYSGKVRLVRTLITKRLTCGFRDERYFGLRLLCPERLPHHSHVRCPHRIVYFCTSLLTLHSPRVHIACVLLCGVGWREQIFSANFATPSPDAATARVGGHGRFSSTTDCEKNTPVCPSFISIPCLIPA